MSRCASMSSLERISWVCCYILKAVTRCLLTRLWTRGLAKNLGAGDRELEYTLPGSCHQAVQCDTGGELQYTLPETSFKPPVRSGRVALHPAGHWHHANQCGLGHHANQCDLGGIIDTTFAAWRRVPLHPVV